MTEIASVSIARPLEEVAAELGKSFEEYGFAVIRDHGIPQDLIDRAEAMSKAFFALPTETKKAYKIEGGGGARGYTPFGVETAKDAKVHDLKEFWHVGRELPAGHPLSEFMGPNVWPGEVDGFRETFEELYAAFEKAGARVLEAIALHLGLPREWFARTVEDGNSVMRLLHYPPLQGSDAEGAIRAAAHGDINTITLLLGAEEAGLELLTTQGEWKAIDTPPGALVVNIGDMLDRLTNGKLRSTTHRVMNPVGEAAYRARYSMPFFLHFRPDFVIETLPGCVDPARPDDHPAPISSHEFLQQRLREIKLA
jgi:isopenicillin N synthase-like dioxygenase